MLALGKPYKQKEIKNAPRHISPQAFAGFPNMLGHSVGMGEWLGRFPLHNKQTKAH